MRTPLLIVLVLSFSATDLLAQRQGGRRFGGHGGDESSVELQNFTFKRVEYPAPSIERVWTNFGIYLPKGYDDEANANVRYPWAIWLHGLNGDYRRFHFGGAAVLDKLRGDGKIPEMIFVAATAGRRSLYFNGERSGDYEDLILRDLVDEVEKSFRVSKKKGHRAIMGVSIGGFGALRFALKHPGMFTAVATHSAAMFPADPDDLSDRYARTAESLGRSIGLDAILGNPIDEAIWSKEIPTAMVASMKPGDLKGLRIYFDAGSDDRYGFAEPNADFHEALEERKIEHTFELIEGGGHSWGSGFTQQALQKSLVFVGASFDAKSTRKESPQKKKTVVPVRRGAN